MHSHALNFCAHWIHELGLNKIGVHVLDLGGRDVNGTTRPLFPGADRYVSVDIVEGRGVDVVADAAELDLRDRFDVVVSTELLEHTPRGAEIVANARKHLKPGGHFLATMAGVGREVHSASGSPRLLPGEYYGNVEHDTLEGWLRDAGFDWWHIDTIETDIRCIAKVSANDE